MRFTTCLALSLLLIGPSLARAQNADWDRAETGALDREAESTDVELAPVERDPYRGALTLETAFFRKSQSSLTTTYISPLLALEHRVGDSVQLGARFGLGGVVSDASGAPTGGLGGLVLDGSRLVVGNPELSGGYYREFVSWPRVVEFYVGTGVTIPTASLPNPGLMFGTDGGEDRYLASAALNGAASTRGLRDSWLWLPDTLAVLLPSARVRLTQGAIEAEGALALALLVPTHNTSVRDNELRGQLLLSFAYHIVPAFRLGAAIAGVAQLSEGRLGGDSPGGDDFQASLDLFAAVQSGGGLAELRFTTNLDGPSGGSFDDYGVWGLRLSLGVRLP